MNRRQALISFASLAVAGRSIPALAQTKKIPEDLTPEEITYLGVAATWFAMYDDAVDRFRDVAQSLDPDLLQDAATLGPLLSGPSAWIAIDLDVSNVTPPDRFVDVHEDITDAFASYSSAANYLFEFLGSAGRQRDIDRSGEALDAGNELLADIREAFGDLLPNRDRLDR